MGSGVKRNTTVRDRHRRIIAKGRPPCALCFKEIDYDAHYLDPLAYTVDHIIALADGGADTLENKVPAHRKCNRSKSGGYQKPKPKKPVAYITARSWS